MCKGRGLVIFTCQNYIRPDPNEPNLPAWVPGRFRGPLTRNQHKVLVGRGFPVPFSSGFFVFLFFGLGFVFLVIWFFVAQSVVI